MGINNPDPGNRQTTQKIIGEIDRTSAIIRDILTESFNNIVVNDSALYEESGPISTKYSRIRSALSSCIQASRLSSNNMVLINRSRLYSGRRSQLKAELTW